MTQDRRLQSALANFHWAGMRANPLIKAMGSSTRTLSR